MATQAPAAPYPVAVLTPTGKDAKVTERVLRDAGLDPVVCADVSALCEALDGELGVLLIGEEALPPSGLEKLIAALDAQPSWSDIPLIVITGDGQLSRTFSSTLGALVERGNLTLLERPVRVATLVTTLRAALSARERQFDMRDYLTERLAAVEALRESDSRLRAAIERERAAREEAEDANKAKGVFLTTMSHELRTPLNAIAGYTELLSMGIAGPVTEQQQGHLARIQKSQRHLLALINDVLNFAKIEAGHIAFDFEQVDMNEMLGDLESFVQPQMQAKHIMYSADCTQGLVADADGEKVRQIMLNLLSNAIKFTPTNGHISVHCTAAGNLIRTAVEDDGAGIAANELEAIFEPFVQVGRRFNSPTEGTGLGLAISRDLARKMRGDLTVTSQVGSGSKFTLTLPQVDSAKVNGGNKLSDA